MNTKQNDKLISEHIEFEKNASGYDAIIGFDYPEKFKWETIGRICNLSKKDYPTQSGFMATTSNKTAETKYGFKTRRAAAVWLAMENESDMVRKLIEEIDKPKNGTDAIIEDSDMIAPFQHSERFFKAAIKTAIINAVSGKAIAKTFDRLEQDLCDVFANDKFKGIGDALTFAECLTELVSDGTLTLWKNFLTVTHAYVLTSRTNNENKSKWYGQAGSDDDTDPDGTDGANAPSPTDDNNGEIHGFLHIITSVMRDRAHRGKPAIDLQNMQTPIILDYHFDGTWLEFVALVETLVLDGTLKTWDRGGLTMYEYRDDEGRTFDNENASVAGKHCMMKPIRQT